MGLDNIVLSGLGALLSLVVSAIGWWVNHVAKSLKDQERRFYEYQVRAEAEFARAAQIDRIFDEIRKLRLEIKEDLRSLHS